MNRRVLHFVFFSFFLCISSNSLGGEDYIKKVNVFCGVEKRCKILKEKFEKILVNKVKAKGVKRVLRIWLFNKDIEKFYYEVSTFKTDHIIDIYVKYKSKLGYFNLSSRAEKFEKPILK